MESEILQIVRTEGPMTGAEISDALGAKDGLLLWRSCRLSQDLVLRRVGTRYLRLDRRVDGFARLSPSILREFLTYTVVGSPDSPLALTRKADQLASHIEAVSQAKARLAHTVISALIDRFEEAFPLRDHACFILGGDIVYGMAHDVPRAERSTGKLVRGSDMDLVVVLNDRFPKRLMHRLDETIYQEKFRLLRTPHIREEIDYVVKDERRVRQQLAFDTFKHMVACKILEEGTFLHGSETLFHTLKAMLRERGIIDRLHRLEASALAFRKEAEETLLLRDLREINNDDISLFYPAEESEEFE